jgi:hypothetical protein
VREIFHPNKKLNMLRTHTHKAITQTHVPSSSSIIATPASHPRNNTSSSSVLDVIINTYRNDDTSFATASRNVVLIVCMRCMDDKARCDNADVLLTTDIALMEN